MRGRKGESAAPSVRRPPAPRRDPPRLGILPELLGYQLRRTQIAVFQNFSRAVEELDVTPGRFGVLEVIAANSGLSQSELGALLGIDRSTIVAVIDRLERDGLVRRLPAPNDRRSHALKLSEKGAVTLALLERRVAAHERDIASGLSAEERTILLSLLARVAKNA
jgi:DNA-binding MarR family transcriptional regulator